MSLAELSGQSHDGMDDCESWLRLDEAADRLGLPRTSVARPVAHELLVGRLSADGLMVQEAGLESFRATRGTRQRKLFEEMRILERELDQIAGTA